MSPAEKEAIEEAVTSAVANAMRTTLTDHAHCRFSDEEARVVHQLFEDFDRSSIFMLGRVGKWLNGAANWIGRAVVVVLLGVVVWGIAQAIKMGWLKP